VPAKEKSPKSTQDLGVDMRRGNQRPVAEDPVQFGGIGANERIHDH
jgi:hypothetical protein